MPALERVLLELILFYMKLLAEISLYPLKEDFIPQIDDFIRRLNSYENVTVWTNDISTQIVGDYDLVMKIIQDEIKRSFENENKMVFVTKFLRR